MFSWRSDRRKETPSQHTHRKQGGRDRHPSHRERDRGNESWDRATHFGYGQEPGYGRTHGSSHSAENYNPGYSYHPPSEGGERHRNPERRRDNPQPADIHDAPYFGSDHMGSDTNYGSERNSRGYSSNPSYLNQSEYGHDSSYEGRWAARPFGERELWGDRNHQGKGPKGYKRSDERICDDVCEALAEHPGVDASDIDVRVENGTVFLSGTIESRRMKRLLEDVAESCTGVRDVRNEVSLMSSESPGAGSSGTTSSGTKAQKPSSKPSPIGQEPH